MGRFPAGVDISVTRYAADAVPSDTKKLEKWLQDRYAEKERYLADYYSRGRSERTSLCGAPLANFSDRTLPNIGILTVRVSHRVTAFPNANDETKPPTKLHAIPSPLQFVTVGIATFVHLMWTYVAVSQKKNTCMHMFLNMALIQNDSLAFTPQMRWYFVLCCGYAIVMTAMGGADRILAKRGRNIVSLTRFMYKAARPNS